LEVIVNTRSQASRSKRGCLWWAGRIVGILVVLLIVFGGLTWVMGARAKAELAALSSNGKQVIAEHSGHNIQHDQPGLVINAIHQVIEAARR
jgi:pimeloyl-ACP methyl ester carboxylesterase